MAKCVACGIIDGHTLGCPVRNRPPAEGQCTNCPVVEASRKARNAFADRLPDFSEPPEEHRGVLLDEPNAQPTMDFFADLPFKPAPPGPLVYTRAFKGLAETYGAPDMSGGDDEIDFVAAAKIVADAGRLRAAVLVSVKNLEWSELAGVGTIAHVIRTLKDALGG